MPNFSLLSDTDSDSESAAAVNDLLAQTKDLCVLEQVSAINCASFSDDSILASDLESRFARLKSFPSAKPSLPPTTASFRRVESKPQTNDVSPKRFAASSEMSSMASSNSSPLKPPTAKTKRSQPKSPSSSSVSSPANSEGKRFGHRRETAAKNDPPSIGCTFWCSPKKSSSSSSSGRKKEIREVDWARRGSDFGWSRNEELLEDLGSFSVEEQRKILRKAMAEQKKISSEARKIVKMGKKASVGKGFGGHVDEDELHSD